MGTACEGDGMDLEVLIAEIVAFGDMMKNLQKDVHREEK